MGDVFLHCRAIQDDQPVGAPGIAFFRGNSVGLGFPRGLRLHGDDRAGQPPGDLRRRPEQFPRAARTPGFQQNHHRPGRTRDRRSNRACRVPAGSFQRTALLENRNRLHDLIGQRAVQHARLARDLQYLGFSHPGRAAGLPPRPLAEVSGREGLQAIRGDRGTRLGRNLGRVAQALGRREHRGQRHFAFHPFVVVLATEPQPRAVHFQTAYRGGERIAQQFGQFGADLSRVRIDRVLPDQNQVERPFSSDRGRQRPGRRQRVGTGEGRVRDHDAVVRAPSDSPADDVLCRGRPQRDDRAASVREPRQLHALADRALAVGVERQDQPFALQPAVRAELHLLELGDLFDQRGNTERGHTCASGWE